MFKLGVNADFQKIFIPPLPTEDTFVLDPPPPAISISEIPGGGGDVWQAPPGISEIFQLGWVPPGKTISVKNAVAPHFYAKDKCFGV